MSTCVKIKKEKSNVAISGGVGKVKVKKEKSCGSTISVSGGSSKKMPSSTKPTTANIKIKTESGSKVSIGSVKSESGKSGTVNITVQIKLEPGARSQAKATAVATGTRKRRKKRRKTRRKTTKTKSKTTKTRTKTRTKTKAKKTTSRVPLVTPQERIAVALGVKRVSVAPHSLPVLRRPEPEDVSKQRAAAGIQPLSLFGNRLDDVPFVEENDEPSTRSTNTPTTTRVFNSNITRVDLLDNIIGKQSQLLKKRDNSEVTRDGNIMESPAKKQRTAHQLNISALSRSIVSTIASSASAGHNSRQRQSTSTYSNNQRTAQANRQSENGSSSLQNRRAAEAAIQRVHRENRSSHVQSSNSDIHRGSQKDDIKPKKEPKVTKELQDRLSDAETISPVGSPLRRQHESSIDNINGPLFVTPNVQTRSIARNHSPVQSSYFNWHTPQTVYSSASSAIKEERDMIRDVFPPMNVESAMVRVKQEPVDKPSSQAGKNVQNCMEMKRKIVKQEPVEDEDVIVLD